MDHPKKNVVKKKCSFILIEDTDHMWLAKLEGVEGLTGYGDTQREAIANLLLGLLNETK